MNETVECVYLLPQTCPFIAFSEINSNDKIG